MSNKPPIHFEGKDALGHVAAAQAKGFISSTEIHGTEIPGHISAGADAARETATLLVLMHVFFTNLLPLILFSIGWLIWKVGRSSWLGWFRLERLHRILQQEKWEIDHNREQERDELRILYRAKGFDGKLLEDVLDVLMADGDRLLHVMVEEELGLSLEEIEHPLKQGLGAFVGTAIASFFCLLGLWLGSTIGLLASAFIIIAIASIISAAYLRNRWTPAIVWNVGIAVFAYGAVFFLSQFLGYNR